LINSSVRRLKFLKNIGPANKYTMITCAFVNESVIITVQK